MHWFHPIGGPVLVLPRGIVPRWRGQRPERGFTPAYEAVTDGLGDDAWVGLDVGGVALSDSQPIGVTEVDGKVRIVLRRSNTSDTIASTVGVGADVQKSGKRIPWPGGEGVMFDAIEAGDALDSGLTAPHPVSLPEGPLDVYIADVQEGALHLVVLEFRPAT